MSRRRYQETKARIIEEILHSEDYSMTASELIEAMEREVSKQDIYKMLNDPRYGIVGKAIVEKKERGKIRKYKKTYTVNTSSFEGLLSMIEFLFASTRYGSIIVRNLDFVFTLCYTSPFGDGLDFDSENETDFMIERRRITIETSYEWSLYHPEEKMGSLDDLYDDDFVQLSLSRARERKGIESIEDKLSYIIAYFGRGLIRAIHEGLPELGISDSEFFDEWDRTYNDFLGETKMMDPGQRFMIGSVKLHESSIENQVNERKFDQWYNSKVGKPLDYLRLNELSFAFTDSKVLASNARKSDSHTIELCFDILIKQVINGYPDYRLLNPGIRNFKLPPLEINHLLSDINKTPINELSFNLETSELLSVVGDNFEPVKTELLKFVHLYFRYYDKIDGGLQKELLHVLGKFNNPSKDYVSDREVLSKIAARISKIKEVSREIEVQESPQREKRSEFYEKYMEKMVSKDMEREKLKSHQSESTQ
jgi:hypothetical protein